MFRRFSIYKIDKESSTIKSFYFKRTDNAPLEYYQPGQFITLSINLLDSKQSLIRNYTLSDAPGKDYFRITVKRESHGKASRYLHDEIKENDTIDVSKPTGDFSISTTSEKPIVLLSGGVGITPMLSMLEYTIEKQNDRRVYFLHSSHDKTVQPMIKRLKVINSENKNVAIAIFHSNPISSEQKHLDYDQNGRISKDYLEKTLPKEDVDYYLCGPFGFMESMYSHLIALNISEDSIFYEFFGDVKTLGSKPEFLDSNSNGYKVNFSKSNKIATWTNDTTSILELAESVGLTPNFSCRMGTCSTCESTLIKGKTEYDPEPFMETPSDKILICCSKPTSNIEVEL